jgi:uncharacterized protein
MIIRLVLLFLIVAAVLWLLKRLFTDDNTQSSDSEKKPQDKSENMLQCKFCGIHTPESSTIAQNNHTYCCQDHADRDQ